jgi:hypothetical protein
VIRTLASSALFALCGVASGHAPEWDPIYDRFTPRVSLQRDGEEVVAIPPTPPGGSVGLELRFPAFPRLGSDPVAAPEGIVGLAIGGAPIVNTEPGRIPIATTPQSAPFGPGVEVPRAPGLDREMKLSGLLGVLLDGYPLYGPVERDGSGPEGLDACHGHVGLTPDHEHVEYHYHLVPGAGRVAPCLRGHVGSVRARPR